jgi:hypothetical protein
MLAAAATVGLFLVWAGFGLAALSAIGADVQDLRVALTAPMVGTALTVIPLFVISNAGVSMDGGARAVLIVLLLASVAVLAVRRPRLSLAVVPVFVVCLLEIVFVGRPMFRFGFDWLANANGDMAYYVLSATHLMRHGLQSAVDFGALAQNRDYPTEAQELTLRGLRPGAQITLAGLASATGRPPVTLYMPMSIAIQMGTVCAAGAFAFQSSGRRWVATVAAALLVVSPMAAYGVLQQLLPQNWGLGLVAALFAWLLRPEVHGRARTRVDLVVIAILTAALFVVAYEVASSFILAYILYVVVLAARRRIDLRSVLLLWGAAIGATAVVVNTFLPKSIHYLTHYVLGFATSQGFSGIAQFGYAVVPTALPGAAGIRSLFDPPQTPHMTFFITLAALFFVGVLVATVFTSFRATAVGLTMVSMFLLALQLARAGNDFGLFKLYMYAQPFLAAMLAVTLSKVRSRNVTTALVVATVGVVALQVPTLERYVRRSFNPIDLRNASQPDLLPRFRRVVADASAPVVAVSDNFALEQLEGASAGRKQVFFLGRNLFGQPWTRRGFDVPSPSPGSAKRLRFEQSPGAARVLSGASCVVLLPSGSQLPLNRRSLPEGSPNLAERRCGGADDLLMFVTSSLGQPATLPANRRAVSIWQLESDPSFPGHTFAGFGRYALFEILGASREVRLVLDLTTSPTQPPNGSYLLPPASVVGAARVPLALVGSGSARVVSPPIRPLMIGGRPYILLDMGRKAQFPIVPRPGVTGLWGSSILLDSRLLTSYVRDISLIPANASRLAPPAALRSIPHDLGYPGLEYSGIFEDGWVAKDSYARISGAPGRLTIRAEVAPAPPHQRLQVLVDGRAVWSRNVKPGRLAIELPVASSPRSRKVELRFAGASRLSPADPRQVAARLAYLGVASPPRS